ncbi:MAG: pilus assembly protein PilM [Phycisphaerales bacterium]
MTRTFGSRRGAIGVDFADGGLRIAQLAERGDQWAVAGAASVDVEPAAFRAMTPERQREVIRSLISGSGCRGRRCVVRLPRESVHVQSARLPTMPAAELRQAVAFEVADRLGVDRALIEADSISVSAGSAPEGRSEVIMLAARRDESLQLLEPLMAAGLRPIAAEPELVSISRIVSRRLRRATDGDTVQAVVNVEARGSTLLVMQGGEPVVVKTLQTGGDAFGAAIVERLRLDEAAVASLRRERRALRAGDPSEGRTEDEVGQKVFDVVRPIMAELGRELVLCLRYYGVTFRGQPPQRIILTGADAHEPGLDRVLAEATRLPAVIEDLDGVLASGAITSRGGPVGPTAGSWCVAAGLSLRPMLSAGGRGVRAA